MIELFHKLGYPEVAAAHAPAIDSMMVWVHWLMAALFFGWGGFYLYSLWRFRASKNPRANYHGVQSHASTWGEIGVVAAETVLLIGFAFPLWNARVNEFPEAGDATIVRVIAEQFAWNIHYPGADGIFGRTDAKLIDKQSNPLGLDADDPAALDDITNINQLHLPVDRPAIIHLRSKDVIHSFGVPEFRVKQDAVPGEDIPIWFVPTVTTPEMRKIKGNDSFNYEIACAQLCGIGHYRMRGFVTIHEEDDYQSWLAEQQPTLAAAEEGEDIW